MLSELTSEQLSEWEAFDKLDPIGDWRTDYWFVNLFSLLSNHMIQVHGKKGSKLTTPTDFVPPWATEPKVAKKEQSVEDMKSALLGIAAAQNKKLKGRVKR